MVNVECRTEESFVSERSFGGGGIGCHENGDEVADEEEVEVVVSASLELTVGGAMLGRTSVKQRKAVVKRSFH